MLCDAINPQSRAKIYAGPKKNTEQNIIAEINNPLFTQLGGGGSSSKNIPDRLLEKHEDGQNIRKSETPFRYDLKCANRTDRYDLKCANRTDFRATRVWKFFTEKVFWAKCVPFSRRTQDFSAGGGCTLVYIYPRGRRCTLVYIYPRGRRCTLKFVPLFREGMRKI